MKKHIKLLFCFCVALAFTACNMDNESEIYHASNDEASFYLATSNYTFGADDPASYQIKLVRGNAKGAVSVPLNPTIDGAATSLFNVPTAEFADGSYETTVTVTFDKTALAPGKTYALKLDIEKKPIQGKRTTFTLNVVRDYVWGPYVTGSFSSTFFSGPWDVAMDKAEGAERYKLVGIFDEGYDFIFDVDDAGKMTPVGIVPNAQGFYPFVTGFIHPTYGMMTFLFDSDPEYSLFDRANKKIYLSFQYTVSAGTFGWKDDIFTW